jgi:glutathione S-transferase
MLIRLYGNPASAATRTVWLLLEAARLPYEFVSVENMTGDHRSEELQTNSKVGKVPTLEMDGKTYWESHAICRLLIQTLQMPDRWYPKDPETRWLADALLAWRHASLFPAAAACLNAITSNVDRLLRELNDEFLKDKKFLLGDQLSIVDYSVATACSMILLAKPDFSEFPVLDRWYQTMTSLPEWEAVHSNGFNSWAGQVRLSRSGSG